MTSPPTAKQAASADKRPAPRNKRRARPSPVEDYSPKGMQRTLEAVERELHQRYPQADVSPIAAAFAFASADEGAARFAGTDPGFKYTRLGNPTVQALVEMRRLLEEGSGGRLSMRIYAGGQLGSERDTLEIGGVEDLVVQVPGGLRFLLAHLLDGVANVDHNHIADPQVFMLQQEKAGHALDATRLAARGESVNFLNAHRDAKTHGLLLQSFQFSKSGISRDGSFQPSLAAEAASATNSCMDCELN